MKYQLLIFISRSSLPPVSDRAQSLYQSVADTVSDQVEPYADSLGKTIRRDVAPTLKDVLKGSLNAVFTGVPKVIKQVFRYFKNSINMY